MPEFWGLKCYKCSTFQVQQAKRSNKFCCSLCHEKQSVLKTYAISNSAKDIRLLVCKLNAQRGEREQAAAERLEEQAASAADFDDNEGLTASAQVSAANRCICGNYGLVLIIFDVLAGKHYSCELLYMAPTAMSAMLAAHSPFSPGCNILIL